MKISAIIRDEKELESIISLLIATSVGRHAISVQGETTQLEERFGYAFVNPEIIQNNPSPQKEPFLMDDFGWVLGLSFAIPFIICIILGIFVIGDLFSARDNVLFGGLGAIVGTFIGGSLSWWIKQRKQSHITQQERQGGYVLWVSVDSDIEKNEVMSILKQHGAKHIKFTV